MCKPKPGPRCSGHMRILYNKSGNDFRKAKVDLLNAENNERHAEETNAPDLQTRRNKTEVVRQIFKAKQAKYAETRALYDSTPEGQEVLERKIDAAIKKGDNKAVHSLTVRAEEGKLLRKQQAEAYHQKLASGAADEDVVPDELKALQGAGQGKRAVVNREGLKGEINIQQHLKNQAAAKGYSMDKIMRVLRSPQRVTPVTQHPGQLRYCGEGIAVICDGNRAITCYPDGKPSSLRADQTDRNARNSQRVKNYENKRKPKA